ncbi:winged helix-turn-helix domain-containing protein [Winogradskyella endarachnes]|uniref:Winged helix family transcriptional regulator n=1 Tax=Winogradskyella endarachnes TaxID=2681965 RepID=A0A6L6U893_9FLAO|nr:winged helix-turn-helix domain-containing protein [Winogradskyella endarachnes]MUU77034.1 winged helix family transcriptional regulator [Winogradskyella endarachnes]
MKQKIIQRFCKFVLFLCIGISWSCSTENQNDVSERTKIALRDAGNSILLFHNDSTSLILPVIQSNSNTYRLSFSESLPIEPEMLVSAIATSLKKSNLPEHYRVEVKHCIDYEVAYSYQMSDRTEQTIIPCSGRTLPNLCYLIELKFINELETTSIYSILITTLIVLSLLFIAFLIHRKILKKTKHKFIDENDNSTKLGSFKFYPDQNKLVKEASEITLSKKECELLFLLASRPNQVIKRNELTKRIWEDNGVFVSRSLDTYISKLRKKLKTDSSIKITNIHGVGYKLEIN